VNGLRHGHPPFARELFHGAQTAGPRSQPRKGGGAQVSSDGEFFSRQLFLQKEISL
jgi:hypothetical protein